MFRRTLTLLATSTVAFACTSTTSCTSLHGHLLNSLNEPWRSTLSSLRLDEILASRGADGDTIFPARVPTKWCPHNAAFEFIPATSAQLAGVAHAAVYWNGTDECFSNLAATIEKLSSTSVRISVSGKSPATSSCDALYAIGTSYHMKTLELSATKPSATVDFNISSPDERVDIEVNGLAVFFLPCGTDGTLISIANTADLWLGTANATAARNAEFLEYRGIWPSPLVPFGNLLTIDASIVPSGTYLSIMAMSGTDTMQVRCDD
jgi:hypothetical protein